MQDDSSMPEPHALTAKEAGEAAIIGLWEWNVQSGALRIDQQWAAIAGYALKELAPMTMERWQQQLHPDDRERAVKSLEELAAGESALLELAMRVRHKCGCWINVLDRGKVLDYDSNGKPLSIAGSRQVLNTAKADSSLPMESSALELRTLIENIPGTIYRIDMSGTTTLFSSPPAFLKDSSAKQSATPLLETLSMIHPDDRQMVTETYSKLTSTPQSVKISYRVVTEQNAIRWIEDQKTSTFSDNGTFKSIDGILFDITDRVAAVEETRRLESQVRKSQRLETIGTLAGGIAHDFNNILTPILGYAEMGLGSMEEDDPMYEYFTEIMQAAERAQKLVSQILTFSRAQDGKPSAVPIQNIINEALKLLRPSLPSTISIEQHIDTNCRSVLADPSQIHQVIVNLCTNAFHAMEHSGGTLTISLKEIQPGEKQAASLPHLLESDYVRLTISDTGNGMDEATIERIFEPFFTTKSIEKGTGLGLSVVHGIVNGAGGQIFAESSQGKGSTFNVYLPVINANSAPETPQKPQVNRQKAKILFVDDEPAAVQMMIIMMQKLGYTIHAEKSPVEALERFRENPEQYDLVITDLTMPEMTGTQLAGELHKLLPSVPIILMTGYGKVVDNDIPLNHYGINRLLTKPVKLAQLASTVNEVLNENNLSKTQ
ncbi:MAG TPA: response regulator [Chlorobaculum parvum]|uniref:histidine kinase n=1 Tax=Chlorobaculum parvum TaxID=274539 RepID=A0A7C5DII1_9CHLB|nr:response regulator [Chlorobaculum parvum]